MIAVTPLASVAIGHRALYVAASPSGYVAAMSKEGVGTLLAPDRTILTRFDLGCKVLGMAISPTGHLLAVVNETSISLIQLPDFVEKHRLEGVYESCLFSRTGLWLWLAQRYGNDAAAVEVCETFSWNILNRVKVADPYGESGLMLFEHPREDRATLWLGAGQDGQLIVWCGYDGKRLKARSFSQLSDTAPPGFDRTGQRFLVVADYGVRLYKYPWGPELGRLNWPDDNDPLAELLAFVDDDRAIVQSGNGRLYLIDVRTMQIVDEMVIAGHERRPSRELWPNLQSVRADELSSDLHIFYALPSGEFLSVHQEMPSEEWRDVLLIWKAPA